MRGGCVSSSCPARVAAPARGAPACTQGCAGARAGWKRMALLVLYFAPDTLRVPENFRAVSERLLVRTPLSYPPNPTLIYCSSARAARAWQPASSRRAARRAHGRRGAGPPAVSAEPARWREAAARRLPRCVLQAVRARGRLRASVAHHAVSVFTLCACDLCLR